MVKCSFYYLDSSRYIHRGTIAFQAEGDKVRIEAVGFSIPSVLPAAYHQIPPAWVRNDIAPCNCREEKSWIELSEGDFGHQIVSLRYFPEGRKLLWETGSQLHFSKMGKMETALIDRRDLIPLIEWLETSTSAPEGLEVEVE